MSTIGVPLYSARGLTQTFSHAEEAKPSPRRTVNGTLRVLGLTTMRKIVSDITCTDQNAPAIDGLWEGMTIVVDCVFELSYKTIGGTPSRTVVSGSSRTTTDGFTYYRPRITFMIVDISMSNDEYAHDYNWKIGLKEV
jgi:hypothetical protein